jgi:hypothetical protein
MLNMRRFRFGWSRAAQTLQNIWGTNTWRSAMPSIELTNDEASVVRGVLESYLREVTSQISNTEKFELREDLKREREIVGKVVASL